MNRDISFTFIDALLVGDTICIKYTESWEPPFIIIRDIQRQKTIFKGHIHRFRRLGLNAQHLSTSRSSDTLKGKTGRWCCVLCRGNDMMWLFIHKASMILTTCKVSGDLCESQVRRMRVGTIEWLGQVRTGPAESPDCGVPWFPYPNPLLVDRS